MQLEKNPVVHLQIPKGGSAQLESACRCDQQGRTVHVTKHKCSETNVVGQSVLLVDVSYIISLACLPITLPATLAVVFGKQNIDGFPDARCSHKAEEAQGFKAHLSRATLMEPFALDAFFTENSVVK